MLYRTIPLTLLYVGACLAAYKETTPSDLMLYSYPTADVPVGQQIELGMDGGPIELPGDYRGLGWNMTSTVMFPNGTTSVLTTEGNTVSEWRLGICTGSAGSREPTDHLAIRPQLTPDTVGQHVLGWDVVYGTSDDRNVTNANESSCDTSRLSLQSWHFNASFNVVAAQPENATFDAKYTTVTTNFPSKPTGKIFVSGAQSIGVGVGSLMAVAALAVGQLVAV